VSAGKPASKQPQERNQEKWQELGEERGQKGELWTGASFFSQRFCSHILSDFLSRKEGEQQGDYQASLCSSNRVQPGQQTSASMLASAPYQLGRPNFPSCPLSPITQGKEDLQPLHLHLRETVS
jgi:hypothetical protein